MKAFLILALVSLALSGCAAAGVAVCLATNCPTLN